MITIYSVDADGRLFTDPKQHFYVDAEVLRKKATLLRTYAVLDQIARRLGYRSFDSLRTSAITRGITDAVLLRWILAGTAANNLKGV